MADPYIVFDHLEALLKAEPSLTVGDRVYTGVVPDRPVMSGGRVLPYIFLQPSPGAGVPERSVSNEPDKIGKRMRFITTVAGGDPRTVLGVAGRLQDFLSGLRLGDGLRLLGGTVQPVELQQEAVVLQTDTTVTPARPYLPLAWTLQVNINPQGDTP